MFAEEAYLVATSLLLFVLFVWRIRADGPVMLYMVLSYFAVIASSVISGIVLLVRKNPKQGCVAIIFAIMAIIYSLMILPALAGAARTT